MCVRSWPWDLSYALRQVTASLTTNENFLNLSSSCQRFLLKPTTNLYLHRYLNTKPSNMVAQSYEDAIEALNGLQTNAAVLQSLRNQTDRTKSNLPATIKYLSRIGVSSDQLDKLSVIHVTGTKGKGSTCAFTERLLRGHGFKTGLYTSPHLVSVTERIRLNGEPLNKDLYTRYFWQVYNALYKAKESENDMPAYFKFLTVLALKLFLEEGVDVAVLEVGIGGEYDCTNVVRRPVVCGISSLDLDHTGILGNTIGSIAWHKAGIMKPGAGVYTVPGQATTAMTVIHDRAKEKECAVQVVPPLEEYGWGDEPLYLGLAGKVQLLNASLALQLAHHWLRQAGSRRVTSDGIKDPTAPSDEESDRQCLAFPLSSKDIAALRHVQWPGRSQVLAVDPRLTLYLDGAHTCQSMAACFEWFTKTSNMHNKSMKRCGPVCRVLFFNSTGDRDVQTLLSNLSAEFFHLALFTTNMAAPPSKSSDQTNLTVSEATQHRRCYQHLQTWQFLRAKTCAQSPNYTSEKQKQDFGTFNFTKDSYSKNVHSDVLKIKSSNNILSVNRPISKVHNCKENRNNSIQGMKSAGPLHKLQQQSGGACMVLSTNSVTADDSSVARTVQASTARSLDETHMLQLTQDFSKLSGEHDDGRGAQALVVPFIEDAVAWLRGEDTQGRVQEPLPNVLRDAAHVQVLVTGSLHLVGGVLGVVSPTDIAACIRCW